MKDYVISVGGQRIEEGLSGTLDPNSKQPSKKPISVMIPVGGYFLPATSMVWGQRVINSKPRADKSTVSATDNDYKGEIKFMNWGEHGGERILIQFLDGCSSYDKVYQEKRLNLTPSNEESSIMLAQGENRFGYDSEETKINFLKVASLNKHSKSKDPRITGFVYTELTDIDKYNEKDVSAIENDFEALKIVHDNSSKAASLKILFTIMGGTKVLADVNDSKNEHQIYPALLRYAKNNSPAFMQAISKYKKKISDLFMKGDSFELMDYTLDGTISMSVNTKKVEIISGADAKGDAVKDWVIENYLEGNVFSSMNTFEEILNKIK